MSSIKTKVVDEAAELKDSAEELYYTINNDDEGPDEKLDYNYLAEEAGRVIKLAGSIKKKLERIAKDIEDQEFPG